MRRHGGYEPHEEPEAKPARPVFAGSGYRLGDETRPSQRITPVQEDDEEPDKTPVVRTLTFYRQGFTVDDGPLRSYTDPNEADFLDDINKGYTLVLLVHASHQTERTHCDLGFGA